MKFKKNLLITSSIATSILTLSILGANTFNKVIKAKDDYELIYNLDFSNEQNLGQNKLANTYEDASIINNEGISSTSNAIKGKTAINLTSKGTRKNYISLPNNLLNQESVTIAGWFKINSNIVPWARMISFNDGTGSNNMDIMPKATNYYNGLHINTFIDGNCIKGNNTDNMLNEGKNSVAAGNTPKADYILPIYDTWVHYAYVLDGTSFKYYENGTLLKELKGDFTPSQFYGENGNFLLGATTYDDTNDFSGSYADFRVYSGSLNEDQIIEEYNFSYSDFLTTSLDFENEYSESVRGYDAIPRGNATISYDETKKSNVLVLDGSITGTATNTRTSIDLPKQTILGHNEITVAFDVYVDSATSNYSRFFDFATGSEQYFTLGAKWQSSGNIYYQNTTNHANGYKDIYTDGIFNKWINVAITAFRNNAYLYIDGVLVGESDNFNYDNAMYWSALKYMQIGRTDYWNDNPLTGKIDNFKIYSKVLNAKEIMLANNLISEVDDSKAVEQQYNALELDYNGTSGFIDLPTSLDDCVSISWSSSNTNIIALDGNVFFPDEKTEVTLTATLTRGEVTMTKKFTYELEKGDIVDSSIIYNVELADVSFLNDSYYYDLMKANLDYMMSLDKDRLLYNYRRIAGLDTKGVSSYGNWISPTSNGAGQFESHYVVALAKASQSMPDYNYKGETILDRLSYLLNAWKECQDAFAIAYPEDAGYLGAIITDNYDSLVEGRTLLSDGTSRWVPWYFHHKTLEALLDVYNYAADEDLRNLGYEMLIKVADWTANEVIYLDDATKEKVLGTEYGGMGEVMFQIYGLTNKKEHYLAAKFFEQNSLLNQIYNNVDILTGNHANTTIPKFLACAAGYEVTGNEYYKQICINAFEMIMTRTYANGSTSIGEHWVGENDTDESLESAETCCSYNMLKLADYLYRWTGDAKYLDYYENVFTNHILASMTPESGLKTYLTNTAFGYYKIYHTAENSFWCCASSGLESFAKLSENIYYQKEDNVTVNMYYPSSLKVAEGVTLTQENVITTTQEASFKIKGSKKFTLSLRVPSWTKNDEVYYNGKKLEVTNEDGFYNITKDFKDGDVITYKFPFIYRLDKLKGSDNQYAIMYGPTLFVCDMGDDLVSDIKASQLDFGSSYTGEIINKIVLAKGTIEESATVTVDEDDNITMKVETLNQGTLTFVPFNQIFHSRYGMYFEYYDSLEDAKLIYDIEGNELKYDFNKESDLNDFTTYSTGEAVSIEKGYLVTPANAETKTIYEEKFDEPFVVECTYAPTIYGGAINGGIYLYASEASASQDGIKAYNVHIDKAAGATSYTLSIYQFNNSYLGNMKQASISYDNKPIKLHILVLNNEISVFVNDGKSPVLSYEIDTSFISDTNAYIGIRSQFAAMKIDSFMIKSAAIDVGTKSLEEAIINGEALDTSSYTSDSAANLEKAINEAKELLEKANLTQEEVNAKEEAINEAIEALITKGNHTNLDKVINSYNNYSEADYTSESWNALKEAINKALEADYDNCSQETIDALYDDCLNALLALEKKQASSEDISSTPTSEPSLEESSSISEEKDEPSKKGCKGASIPSFIGLFSLASALILKKKKR